MKISKIYNVINKMPKHILVQKLILLPLLVFSSLFLAPFTYAASSIMSITPSTGSYTLGNTPISSSLVIDGKGQAFNAAKASVTLSPNLQLSNLILGDCDFAFIQTPTTTNPSFIGAILGGSSNTCTVYTLELTPLAPGSADVTLSNASVKKYITGEELLQSIQNATYSLSSSQGSSGQTPTGSTNNSSPTPTVTQSNPGLSTIVLTMLDNDNKPISDATVTISNSTQVSSSQDGQTQTESSGPPKIQAKTDANGIVQITNVPPGIHSVEIQKDGKPIASKILNVSENNPVMKLGIKQEKLPLDLLRATIIIITILAILAFILIYFRQFLSQLLGMVFRSS